jgi:hypothetical protein
VPSGYETLPQDRLWYLVTELLEAGETPREILDTAKEAIGDWRLGKRTKAEAG